MKDSKLASGRCDHEKRSFMAVFKMFPDDDATERLWLRFL